MPTPFPLVSEAALEDVSQRGRAIYQTKLAAQLVPAPGRRFVAIHVDTEDYAVGASSGDAMRALLEHHPADGRLYIRKIGSEPDYGLAARLLAGEMAAERPK